MTKCWVYCTAHPMPQLVPVINIHQCLGLTQRDGSKRGEVTQEYMEKPMCHHISIINVLNVSNVTWNENAMVLTGITKTSGIISLIRSKWPSYFKTCQSNEAYPM